MAYTTKDLEKQQGISKDKLSYAVTQGGNAAALAGGIAKQGFNTAKQLGYGIGTIKTLLNKPKDYEESEEVKRAQEELKTHYNSKPGDYQSNYADQIQGLLKDYENTKDFQYDFNADPLYQQYKDQYIQQGKMAMQDTMGNAAALTGGYGSSYASTAGNQAYQSSLNDLNNVIPSLYDRAYGKYRDDKSDKLQHMQVLQNLDDADYKKYQDTLSDYYNTLNYLQSQSQYLSESDYNRYLNQLAQWQYELEYYTGRADAAQQQSNWQSEQNRQYMQDYVNQRNWQNQFDYQKEQDALAQNNWQQQFDYGKEQDALAQSNWQKQFDYGKEQDALAQNNWQQQFDYGKQQDALAQSNWQKQFDYGKQQDARDYNLKQQQFEHDKYMDSLRAQGYSTSSSSSSGGSGYSGSSSGSGGKQTATKSKAASEFIGAQPTRYEFGVRPALKNQYGSYENYIKTKMSQNKNLTDEDIAILSQHYGLY
jgi:hypothetical protein|nr:MAG TPA: hypothetical protein [Caudoviricetes sp.]